MEKKISKKILEFLKKKFFLKNFSEKFELELEKNLNLNLRGLKDYDVRGIMTSEGIKGL